MYIGYDGPNKADNNNYWYVRNQSNTDIISATYGGAVGIRTDNPRNQLHLQGDIYSTQFRMTIPSANNTSSTGDVNMQMWCGEPGVNWESGGIGCNVTNYTTYRYPTNSNSTDLSLIHI